MFQVFIADEEVVFEANFSLKEEFMNPSSIELYKVYPKSWKGTNKLLKSYYFPSDYSRCKILRDGELYFTGIVKNTADMELNPFKPHYCSVQILDPSTLLSEGTTLDYVITRKTISQAINQVIDSISDYGFVAGNITIPAEKDTLIGAYSTVDKAPFDVFQYLSLISGTRWGTHMIDENTTAIDFFSPDLLDNLGTISINEKYCNQNHIEDILYDYSTTDYRNKQIITSDSVYAEINQIETVYSDGYNKDFSTEQAIGNIISISVDGENKTFVTEAQKNAGYTADFYYTPSESGFSASDIYSNSTEIIIEYVPMVRGREVSINSTEIERISTNLERNGEIARYENRSDITSSDELQAVGRTYIKYKGMPEINLTIKSTNNFLQLGGKYVLESPLQDINGSYLVKTKTTDIIQSGNFQHIHYTYELTNSFDTENELNYFDNQRSKNSGNISDGEYVERNVDINSNCNVIFENLVIQEITSSSVLDCMLDSPLA